MTLSDKIKLGDFDVISGKHLECIYLDDVKEAVQELKDAIDDPEYYKNLTKENILEIIDEIFGPELTK